MNLTKLRRRIHFGLVILSLTASSTAAAQLSKEHGDRLERKIDEIAKNATMEVVRSKRTPMSELEINSYLNFNVRDKIPRGLTNPQISLIGNGTLSGRVLVDIDEFKRHRASGGLMDPLSYISGQVPVTARGVLRAQDGKGRFQLVSAEILGVPLPKPILQELVAYFSRTPENPNGINMDAPFNLPAKIREVVVNPREAVVVQ